MPTSSTNKGLTILGIDPGFADCGYGVITKRGTNLSYITCDSLKSPKGKALEKRLSSLHEGLNRVIKTYKPDLMAIESLFFFKNKKTAIDVAQSRGVVLLSAGMHKIPVVTYTPPQIKQSLTNSGRAEKNQVETMVKVILKTKSLPASDDAVDALAVAITAAFRMKFA